MTRFQWHEVVRVDSPVFLVSSSHQACRYTTADQRPLTAGYYLAIAQSGTVRSSYGHDTRYIGPFLTLSEAQLFRSSALALNIVELDITEPVTPIPVDSSHRDWLLSHSGLQQPDG